MDEPRKAGALLDLGSVLGCGLAAALVGSGPAALRIAAASDADGSWLVLAACATPFTCVAVAILRETYAGLRAFMGDRRGFVRTFVSLWLLLFTPLTFVLGSILRANTHHRPLAAVTFALVAMVMLVGSGAFANRFARILESMREPSPRAYALTAACVHALLIALVLLTARRLHTKLSMQSAATMVDVTALGLAAALAARPELRGVRVLGLLGPVAAVAVVALGLTRVGPDVWPVVSDRAPAFAALLALFR